jgi:hypothetical protein
VASRWLSSGGSAGAVRLRQCLLAASIVFAVSWWANPGFDRLGYDDDTDDYVSIAHSFSDVEVRDRPPVYPLLLRLCLFLFGDGWEHAVIAAQSVMLALIAAAITDVLWRMVVPPWAAVAVAAACCLTPGLLFMGGMVLPEACLALMLTLLWRQTILLADPQGLSSRQLFRAAFWCGVMSGVVALVKPVWILGAIPLAAAVLLPQRKGGSRGFALAATVVLVHFAVVVPWQLFLIEKYGQYDLSRTGPANINMSGIRNGMTRDAIGTPLYEFLGTTGLLDRALRLTWDNFDEFAQIKAAIPWKYRIDTAFEKAILRKDGLRYVASQLGRAPEFFVVHPPPPDRLLFPHLGSRLRRLYARIYNAVFRIDVSGRSLPILPVLLAVGFTSCFVARRDRTVGIVSAAIVAYYWLVVALLIYQEPLFIRMRIALEPVLLLVAAVPFCQLLRFLKTRGGPRLSTSAGPAD